MCGGIGRCPCRRGAGECSWGLAASFGGTPAGCGGGDTYCGCDTGCVPCFLGVGDFVPDCFAGGGTRGALAGRRGRETVRGADFPPVAGCGVNLDWRPGLGRAGCVIPRAGGLRTEEGALAGREGFLASIKKKSPAVLVSRVSQVGYRGHPLNFLLAKPRCFTSTHSRLGCSKGACFSYLDR